MQMLLELSRRWHLVMVHFQRNKMTIGSSKRRGWHLILCKVRYIRCPKAVRLQIGQ